MRAAIVILVLMMAGGCSSFNSRWKQATARPAPANDVTGPWEGEWRSHRGHGGGNLRCVIEPSSDAAADYLAHFRATFWGIFKASYTIPLTRQPDAPNTFAGQKDLGWLAGGAYSCRAEITPATFKATYESDGDRGVFQLARPR